MNASSLNRFSLKGQKAKAGTDNNSNEDSNASDECLIGYLSNLNPRRTKRTNMVKRCSSEPEKMVGLVGVNKHPNGLLE